MSNSFKYLMRILGIGVLISTFIFVTIIAIELAYGRVFRFNVSLLEEFLQYSVFGVVLTYLNSTYFDYLNKKVVWDKYKKYRIGIGIVGSIFVTLIGIFLVRFFLIVIVYQIEFNQFVSQEKFQFYFISLLITMVVSLVFHTIYFYKNLQEQKVIEQKIIAGTASAQFESLKNQIDPHFLFNSLNVLSALIEEHPQNAQKFTTSLSKIYRYVLEQKDKELVPVSEELDFAVLYIGLLQMRFEDSLTYEVECKDLPEEGKVVPLSLQLLLENSIKHNIVSEEKPLHLIIGFDGANLTVQNNLQRKEVLGNRKGVGLENIVNRYSILTHKQVAIETSEVYFKVKIPILTKQISNMKTNINNYNENLAYQKAEKRVKDLKEFYGNLLSYCLVIPFLIFINLYTYSDFLWFFFPMIGWGIGLAFHGFSVFGFAKNWEEKKIRAFMDESAKQESKWD
jgi:two-component system, LytTR family, sensor kinase